jgi:NAD-dependent SIR2 family protein deacetylase
MAKKDLKKTDKCRNPSCIWCQNNIDFDLPEQLVDDFMKGEVVIFAGSGISTESKNILPETLYESIAYDLGYKKCHKPFSELMDEYCLKPNGRINLLSEIKARFDNIKSFPELYRDATRFHRELATIPQLKTIITTNWDTYFEDECGALPFINPEDFTFWNTGERKVFKIHGSINNFGSIIATKKDYAKCLKNLHKGIAGSILKSVLATKTIVFIGYSCPCEFLNTFDIYIKRLSEY